MLAPAPPPRAISREWIGLAVIALPCLLYSMDLTVLNLAVPHLSADLNPASAQLLWIVDIYGFLVAGSLGSLGTAVYRGVMDGVVPEGVPADVASVAQGTPGAAIAVARLLPADTATVLIAAARAAFARAFELTAWVCAAIALTAAVATMILLRDPGDRPSPAPQHDGPASVAAG